MSKETDPTIVAAPALPVFSAEPSAPAIARKTELLELASLITAVTTEEEEMDAIDAASQIKAVEQGTEKAREAVKRPFLEAGRTIDKAAKDYLASLTKERLRVEGLLSGWALKKRQAFEAEQARLRAIAEAEARAEQARLDAARAEEAALADMMGEPAPAPAPTVVPVMAVPTDTPKMDGASFKQEYDFEVTDIHALYEYNRLFVKLEVNRADLKAWLNLAGNKPEDVPGIRVFQVNKATVRAARATAPRVIE